MDCWQYFSLHQNNSNCAVFAEFELKKKTNLLFIFKLICLAKEHSEISIWWKKRFAGCSAPEFYVAVGLNLVFFTRVVDLCHAVRIQVYRKYCALFPFKSNMWKQLFHIRYYEIWATKRSLMCIFKLLEKISKHPSVSFCASQQLVQC